MKKLLFILMAAQFSVAFYACKKQKHCPGFEENDKVEFCYLKPDTLTFVNNETGVFQVFISQINMSEPYTYECKEIEMVCPCTNYIEVLATDTKTSTPYAFLRMEQSDVSEMQYFKYNVQGFEFEFDFRNELPYIDQMEHLKHFSSVKVGDLVYTDVILITNLDFSKANIYQVYFNKRNGVLRFIENTSRESWAIKNY